MTVRKTATFVYCCGPTCKVSVEVVDANDAPEGWYRIEQEKDNKYHVQESWEFHSLMCVQKWAKGRRDALEGKPKRSGYHPSSQSEEVLEAFQMDPETSLSIMEVSQLTGIERSSVTRRVNELYANGKLEQTAERRGPNGARYKVMA